MDAQNALIDDGGKGQEVEHAVELLPEPRRVPLAALVVESVNAVDARHLVVAAQHEEVLWVLDLVGEQEADGLERLLPPVHVVAQEQVVGLWREPAVLEEAQQVRVLAVDVA